MKRFLSTVFKWLELAFSDAKSEREVMNVKNKDKT